MCGIVGMFGNLNSQTNKMLRDMQLFDTVRGLDATGILRVPISGAPIFAKKVGLPDVLWKSCDMFNSRGILKTVNKVVIGHNRAATIGNITDANAHPFNHGHVCGVHNGSLHDWADLEEYLTTEVDSDSVFKTIAAKGAAHTWKSFRGAAALVWWDSKASRLFMIRNSERPLYLMENVDSSVVFFASEPWMIRIAADRHKVSLKKDKGGTLSSPQRLNENVLYEFSVTATGYKLESHVELEKKPTPPVSNLHYGSFPGVGNRVQRICSNWAENTKRGPKESRNQVVEVTTFTEKSDRAYAKFDEPVKVDGKEIRYISLMFPHKKAHDAFAALYKQGVRKFTTNARVRYKGGNTLTSSISAEQITPFVKPLEEEENLGKADEKKIEVLSPPQIFLGFNGATFNSEEEWNRQFSFGNTGSNPTCAWCDITLNAKDSSRYYYKARDVCLCEDCGNDKEVQKQISCYM